MRRARVVVMAAFASFGCGGQTSDGDGGADAKSKDAPSDVLQSFDVITSGCVNGSSQSYPVDASACTAQLSSSFSCSGSICSWSVVVPCSAPSDAGADADAGASDGGVDCDAICNDVQPSGPHSAPTGFCQSTTNDAGTTISCGGCGV